MYPFRVFISYAREDRLLARERHDRLAAFVTHPPTVLRSLRRFDGDLASYARRGGSSRREALARIDDVLRTCEQAPAAPPGRTRPGLSLCRPAWFPRRRR